ncbi:hypothetical protein EW146_g2156 [Bondarzewia mesenterica]|uniref:RRM domain-containing protein n=1 Tax=Bondarzewia mesenterica TaxID=1095465 RepID=A0A4S4M3H2_9AGAM|nr:hypothetical protein EW146_g2156 [Bondarzewia mesenterica]
MDESLTKRLHISGLTPAITREDLSRRLKSFGTITALDGVGAVDALGQPRKFAYATLESTKANLAKCMNVLSGSTWKGTKLRIGEAKPDYRERIALENSAPDPEPPRKRMRVHGKNAADMSLITPENVHLHIQWHVTPLGRLIRPMRIRPARPLDPPVDSLAQSKKKKRFGREECRGKEEVKWGSGHVMGTFLENTSEIQVGGRGQVTDVDREESSEEDESEEDEDIVEKNHDIVQVDAETVMQPAEPAESMPKSSPAPQPQTDAPALAPTSADELTQEKIKSLDLLRSMFGDADDQDWGGTESLGSDIDMADLADPESADEEVEDQDDLQVQAEEMDTPPTDPQSAVTQIEPEAPVHQPVTQVKKLKDLFAPREEEGTSILIAYHFLFIPTFYVFAPSAGFSLLGHLDLDLELSDDPTLIPIPTSFSHPILPTHPQRTPFHPSIKSTPTNTFHLDTSRALFFPSRGHTKGTWRASGFYRTESEDAIRKQWEESKGELTREWKRRHREALKSRRRRGGEGSVGEGV